MPLPPRPRRALGFAATLICGLALGVAMVALWRPEKLPRRAGDIRVAWPGMVTQ